MERKTLRHERIKLKTVNNKNKCTDGHFFSIFVENCNLENEDTQFLEKRFNEKLTIPLVIETVSQ